MRPLTVTTTQTIGRYRVLSVLGTGAMGEVLRARDERLGRDVAIKRVRNIFGAMTAVFQARFEAEARALAALAHPGVVQVFDLGVDEEAPYLVMELVEGPSLRDVIEQRGPLPPAEVRSLGIQLGRALEAAHARGILHRDIKPANVLQAPGGLWKLADFGVARIPDSEMTMNGQFLGTPAYAPPEALSLGHFSPASDVFGLAITLVQAASGTKPRGDATVAELIAHASDPISLAGVPLELRPALAAALATQPAKRPDAAAFAHLLAGGAPGASAAVADGTIAVPDETIGVPDATVGVPDRTLGVPDGTAMTAPARHAALPIAEPRRRRTLVLALAGLAALIGIAAIAGTCGDRSKAPARGIGAPVAAPVEPPPYEHEPEREPEPGEPMRFEMPPGLDGRGAHEWRKVAEKVNKGEYEDALKKLWEFERRFGGSPESSRLRAWLEESYQPDDDY